MKTLCSEDLPYNPLVRGIFNLRFLSQVIGSSGQTRFQMKNGRPVIIGLPKIDFINDKASKPVGINKHIGRRPIVAFGNSDGDLQMLQWTAAGEKKSLCVYVHHTDAEREWAYDRESSVGRLDKGLGTAIRKKWTIVDIARDWKVIFPKSEWPAEFAAACHIQDSRIELTVHQRDHPYLSAQQINPRS
jgi:hypothetical protein